MPTVKGRAEVQRFLAQIPSIMEKKILRGAARAAASVVADEARERVTSDFVRDRLVLRSKVEGTRIVVRITVKDGWAKSLGTWLEWGTSPHFISIADADRGGMTVGRINRLDREAAGEGRQGPGHSLLIGGTFVGPMVFHPGAQAHPFLRVSLDMKEAEAVAAAQGYISARWSPNGLATATAPDGSDDQ